MAVTGDSVPGGGRPTVIDFRPGGTVRSPSRMKWQAFNTGLLLVCSAAAIAQTPYKAPRAADGHPDLNGIWQANNTANWDLEGHAASAGPVASLGATHAVPPGLGVVEGGKIPYLPGDAEAKKKQNFARRFVDDPEIKCYLPGVPRAAYMPYPFQIVQSRNQVQFVYEYAGGVRSVNMGKASEAPVDSWMGWSAGHWEGDTLVVDVTGLNNKTWFDRAGDFHSNELHVVERYMPRSADTLLYEATIEDPKTFSRPWKISMPLYRRVEKEARLLEFKCPEFAEELIYGPLRKQPKK
jgi:hypothetical protein